MSKLIQISSDYNTVLDGADVFIKVDEATAVTLRVICGEISVGVLVSGCWFDVDGEALYDLFYCYPEVGDRYQELKEVLPK